MSLASKIQKIFGGLVLVIGAVIVLTGLTVWHSMLGVNTMIFGELLFIEAKLGEKSE